MGSRPRFSPIEYKTRLNCGWRRSRAAPTRGLYEIDRPPAQACPDERDWPPDLFSPQQSRASAGRQSPDVQWLWHPVIGRCRRVPEARAPQSFLAGWAAGFRAARQLQQTARNCIDLARARTGAPAFDWGHRRRSQTSRKPEANKETLTGTEGFC